MTDATLARLAAILRARSGLALGDDKQYLLDSRLSPLLRREGLADLGTLATRLEAEPGGSLAREVVEAMTTGETLFFRDMRPWAYLRDRLLPRLSAGLPPGGALRIWSAAASAGQEAYSLAMLLADGGPAGEIIATDIARGRLRYAAAGLYTTFEVQRGLPPELLLRHFRREARGWRVAPALRALVDFREHNLLDDPIALGRFQLVLCRNVLLYLDPSARLVVLRAIASRLVEGGVLFLGAAETMPGGLGYVPLPGMRGAYLHETASTAGLAKHDSFVVV